MPKFSRKRTLEKRQSKFIQIMKDSMEISTQTLKNALMFNIKATILRNNIFLNQFSKKKFLKLCTRLKNLYQWIVALTELVSLTQSFFKLKTQSKKWLLVKINLILIVLKKLPFQIIILVSPLKVNVLKKLKSLSLLSSRRLKMRRQQKEQSKIQQRMWLLTKK